MPISITAANVLAGAGAKMKDGTAGETITAGMVVYRDASDGKKFRKADVNAAESAAVEGIALNNASNNQPLTIQTEGEITIGGTLVPGHEYGIDDNVAGGIIPSASFGQEGAYPTFLGAAKTVAILSLNIQALGVEYVAE